MTALDAPPQYEELGVLHHDPGADHHQHRGVDVGIQHRPQQEELDRGTDGASDDHRKDEGEEEIYAQGHFEKKYRVGAERIKLAMGEIDHPHDAEDQRQADSQERVGAPEDQRVDEVLK